MKNKIVFMFMIFLLGGAGEAMAQVIVDQPCRFNSSYNDINDHRSHWDDPDLHESEIAVDLGANGRKPYGLGSRIMSYQTCNGTEALASINGVVRYKNLNGWFACDLDGNGPREPFNTRNSEIIIEGDDGHYVSYVHMDLDAPNTVQVGQRVNVGDVIGTIGAVGCSSPNFPHIHFRVFRGRYNPNDHYNLDARLNHDQWFFGPVEPGNNRNNLLEEQANRDKRFEIRAEYLNRDGVELCLDVPGANFFEGADLQLWECNGTKAQKFAYEKKSGEIRAYTQPNLCLDVPGAEFFEGAELQLWGCNGSNAQKFYYNTFENQIQVFKEPNLCVDIRNASSENGTVIQLVRCRGGEAAQRFLMTRAVQIKSLIPGVNREAMCLDVVNADFHHERGGERDGDIQLLHCKRNEVAQRFAYEHWTGTIHAYHHPDVCLDISNSEFRDTTQIQMHGCNQTDAQKFHYYKETKFLRTWANPNFCIDVDGSGNRDGTRIQLWECNETNAQRFYLNDLWR